ncbi:Anion transporter [Helicobacter valdiviensis]|uniref:Anion transporter n=1 Tax=Helicobacter valdiviensis TaxID=1458358 RepID=A0A2W6NL03_9HELI|nr:DASS family sodium-coupled anion symporter [Helicobacter valdiviensis]PZT48096.1 Anion transporter [Helicobacter valdiviensis]
MERLGKTLGILGADILIFVLLYYFLSFEREANLGICILVFAAILWISEAIHIAFTALLIPLLAIILGLNDVVGAFREFANPTIFLFFGGFALACALHIQGIDRWIANRLMLLAKGNMRLAFFMLFILSALISMWISNTATAAIMLPLGLGVLSNLDFSKDRNTFVFVLLGIAYSAGIGGFGTLVGSPPNAMTARFLEMDFLEWMSIGVPFVLVMLPACIFILWQLLKPKLHKNFQIQREEFAWNMQKIITLAIFILTAFAWIFSAKISSILGGIKEMDTYIAICAVVLIGISGVASWKDIQKNTDFGVLILFGGGLTLNAILQDTGASRLIANEIVKILGKDSFVLVVFVVAFFVILLTEFTSNTASAALLLPIFSVAGEALGMPKDILPLVVAMGAGCAFMLPVATPPNAIVYGTGYIKQIEMVKYGGLVNLFGMCAITFFAYFIWA